MANRIETSTLTRSHQHQNDFAQVIERMGLAIMGALCGLFVAALVAKANIEAINSIGVLFSVVLYAAVGFYFGTSIPSLPSGASGRSLSDNIPRHRCSARFDLLSCSARVSPSF